MKINTLGLITIIVVVAGLVGYGIFYKYADGETTIIYCGPGKANPVTVFKNPTKAFPAFAQDYELNVKGTLDLTKTLKDSAVPSLSADVGYKQKIVALREQLNQDNIRMEDVLKAAFYAFNQRPCDATAAKRYQDLVDTMAIKTRELERFQASVTQPTQKGANQEDKGSHILVKDTSVINTSIDKLHENYFQH